MNTGEGGPSLNSHAHIEPAGFDTSPRRRQFTNGPVVVFCSVGTFVSFDPCPLSLCAFPGAVEEERFWLLCCSDGKASPSLPWLMAAPHRRRNQRAEALTAQWAVARVVRLNILPSFLLGEMCPRCISSDEQCSICAQISVQPQAIKTAAPKNSKRSPCKNTPASYFSFIG